LRVVFGGGRILCFGRFGEIYAFIKFAVRLCSQEPKFSLAVFAPARVLSLYIALISTEIFSIISLAHRFYSHFAYVLTFCA
jgi:hypothetical protein